MPSKPLRRARSLHRPLWHLLAVTALMLIAPCVLPVTVGGLNEAEVLVADKTDKARAEATTEALRQVLIKMSGDRKGVAGKPELLTNAGSYVLQYQYREVPASDGDTTGPMLALWVQFDEAPVRSLLTDAGLALWQSERPSLLMWAVTEQGDTASIASSEDVGVTATSARRHTERRGLPLVLPLQDLDEQGHISAKDIKQDDVARVTEASSRYGAQEVATAVVSMGQDGGWRGRFTLLRGEHGSTWVAQGKTPDEVMAQGVDQIADALAAPAAAVSGSAEAVEVHIEGIANAQQFAQVESYLRTVPGVSSVMLRRLEPAYVTFSVNVAGGMATLTQAASAGQVLQPVGTGGGQFRLHQAATASAPAAAVPQTP